SFSSIATSDCSSSDPFLPSSTSASVQSPMDAVDVVKTLAGRCRFGKGFKSCLIDMRDSETKDAQWLLSEPNP
ncbi:unnamed protein product, partial [Mycena citricolor]